jgi:hypothetical protein
LELTARRSAGILDQHKQKSSRDATIRKKIDAYNFEDYNERVIELLARITTINIETMEIAAATQSLDRTPAELGNAMRARPGRCRGS